MGRRKIRFWPKGVEENAIKMKNSEEKIKCVGKS